MRTRWFLHPLFVFIFSIVALGGSLFIYIRSYLRVNDAFTDFVVKKGLDPNQFLESETWLTIILLSLLVAIILACMAIVYIYYHKVIELYRMQQNFINGFTHELKTPIASIRLYLDTFLKHELNREQQVKYLNFMIKDTERLASNVNQILTLGKLEEKKFKGKFSKVNIHQLLSEYLERNKHLFEDVTVNIDCDKEYFIEGSVELIDGLFSNLIQNAVDYSNDKANISISLKQRNQNLVVSVTDSGIGISSKELKNIFKKFYQIGKSSKGSGLGLYFCSQIMKIHGGKIEAFSSGLGKGTSMTLTFPGVTNV